VLLRTFRGYVLPPIPLDSVPTFIGDSEHLPPLVRNDRGSLCFDTVPRSLLHGIGRRVKGTVSEGVGAESSKGGTI
jgi:hypothetical protein